MIPQACNSAFPFLCYALTARARKQWKLLMHCTGQGLPDLLAPIRSLLAVHWSDVVFQCLSRATAAHTRRINSSLKRNETNALAFFPPENIGQFDASWYLYFWALQTVLFSKSSPLQSHWANWANGLNWLNWPSTALFAPFGGALVAGAFKIQHCVIVLSCTSQVSLFKTSDHRSTNILDLGYI